MLSMIVAISKNGVIGDSNTTNGLPWHYPDDLAYYKQKCINKINIMGYKTYKQIGHALPNRLTIVLSRNKDLELDDAIVINDVNKLINIIKDIDQEIMICGGKEIFDLFYPYIDKVYLTRIDKEYNGNVYYQPDLTNFSITDRITGHQKELVFETYARNK